jgi:transposase
MRAYWAYLKGGWEAVDVTRGHRPVGSGRRLTAKQEREIQRRILDKTPDQYKLPYALWTRQAVAEMVEKRYGVRLPVRTMGKYLARWGFTPQKPLKKALEQNPEAVDVWLKQEYPAIAKQAKTEGGSIHWLDETGLRSDDVRGRGYAPKGLTPLLLVPRKRSSLSIISTVTNKGEMRWRTFSGALKAASLIDFLKRLIKGQSCRVFLIMDNLRVHHSKLVKAWVAENSEKIAVFYLPSYSPELNPDELLNADLKQAVTKRVPSRTKLALTQTAASALRSIQRRPQRIQNYFQHPSVQYAA